MRIERQLRDGLHVFGLLNLFQNTLVGFEFAGYFGDGINQWTIRLRNLR